MFGVIYPPQVALAGLGKVVGAPYAADGLLAVIAGLAGVEMTLALATAGSSAATSAAIVRVARADTTGSPDSRRSEPTYAAASSGVPSGTAPWDSACTGMVMGRLPGSGAARRSGTGHCGPP